MIYLAPMAGVTDKAFRILCKRMGADRLVSEMISAKGLFYGSAKTRELMDIDSEEAPVSIQIFGSSPEIMAKVTPDVISSGAAAIDINMGCPMPKIVNNGDGSALMKEPQLAGKIVRAVCDASTVPVTVKIRSGWDSNTAAEFAKVLEANGASAITVHARTSRQLYSGNADWNVIKEVKSAVSIPVIGNGDINSPESAKRMIEETGCDGIMIGRAAEGNPFIFRQVSEYLKTGKIPDLPTYRERIQTAISHAEMLCRYKGEKRGMLEARKHIAWYMKGIPKSNTMKSKIFELDTLSEAVGLLENWSATLL